MDSLPLSGGGHYVASKSLFDSINYDFHIYHVFNHFVTVTVEKYHVERAWHACSLRSSEVMRLLRGERISGQDVWTLFLDDSLKTIYSAISHPRIYLTYTTS